MVRIRIYMSQNNGTFPKKLSQLPKREGYRNSILDGWERELLFTINDSKTVTLKSLGRDGKVGGTGKDGDFISIYKVDEDGQLQLFKEINSFED